MSVVRFGECVSGEVRVSDDGRIVWRKKLDDCGEAWAFTERALGRGESVQVQVIQIAKMSSHYEPLQIGVVSDDPNSIIKTITQKDISLKNSFYLRRNILHHQNDENITLTEEYDLNLSDLQEGDLVGVKISEVGELYFTCNGVAYRKASDIILESAWVFVNLADSFSCVVIIPSISPITISHKEKLLKKMARKIENMADAYESKVYFHNYCGKEVVLSDNNTVAKRKNPTNEFRNAVVISRDPLVTNEMFRLRIEGLINKWNGSIELGVTYHNPDMFELPTAMNNLRSGTLVLSGNSILTNGHGTRLPYCTTSLDDLKIGDEIGIIRKENSNIHFFMNELDMGVAGNIPIEKDLWVIADLYGRTIKVSIPRSIISPVVLDQSPSVVTSIFDEDSLVFHKLCGTNVKLNNDMTRASRINDQEFNNGVIFSHRPLKVGELWRVKLLRCEERWAGNMEVGISTKNPTEGEIPSTITDIADQCTMMITTNGLVVNGCPLSQSEHTMDLDMVHSILLSGIPNLSDGNSIGVQLLENNNVQFFVNEADLGIMSLDCDQEVYGIIDLYGKAAEVELCSEYNDVGNNSITSVKAVKSHQYEDHHDEVDSSSNFQSLLFSEEVNDYSRNISLLQSESSLCDALREADRSFLRLLSGNEEVNRLTDQCDEKPLLFHHIHGRNVILTNNGKTAFRPSPNNEFKNALVMSSRPLNTDEIFEICVDKMTDHWSGSLEMGVTLNNPVDLNFPGTLSQLDKDCWILSGSCIMNNGITARNDYSLDMDSITVNSRIGVIRRRSGMLHFLLNGKDMGAAYFDVPSGIYAILDLYGQCSKVSITSRTGSSSSAADHINDDSQPILPTTSPSIKEPVFSQKNQDEFDSRCGPSRLSPFDRVMLVFKENISGLSEDEGLTSISRRVNLDTKVSPFKEDGDFVGNLFDGDNVFGDGIRWTKSLGFKADNQRKNCVVQSKFTLMSNVFYEVTFSISKGERRSHEPISFGFTTDKFSSQRYLADNVFQLTAPNWIFHGQGLLVDNKVYSTNFAPALSSLKKRLSVGVYLTEECSLEVYVDRVKIATLVSNYNKNLYMLMDLKGWYDCVRITDLFRKISPNSSLSNRSLQRPLHFNQNQLHSSFESESAISVENEIMNLPEDPDLEDRITEAILKELYELLPLFMANLRGVETTKLIEKMVVSNNDIVLNVKKDIDQDNVYGIIDKSGIRDLLVTELSRRFSYLTDLEKTGSCHHEIGRVLSRKVIMHNSEYDHNTKVFVVPQSCLFVEGDSKLRRSISGNEFGLALINQELKSEKYKSYEFQSIKINSENDLEAPLVNNNFPWASFLLRLNTSPRLRMYLDFF